MEDRNWLAQQFEENRGHLRGVAYRMLGSLSEAEDAVQETWLRLNRSDADSIQNLGGWLTTVVARVCLDMLRSRKAKSEESLEDRATDPAVQRTAPGDPEQEALLADSVGLALLVVLDRLTPAERLAFVLHDVFAISFEEIGEIVGRNATAARQLASRARRRVQGEDPAPDVRIDEQRKVVEAFLTALRRGDVEGILNVLDPDVVVRVDAAAGRSGEATEIHGARNWAQGAVTYSRAGRYAQTAMINGSVGAVFAPGGKLARVILFTFAEGRIVQAEIVGDPARLRDLDLAVL